MQEANCYKLVNVSSNISLHRFGRIVKQSRKEKKRYPSDIPRGRGLEFGSDGQFSFEPPALCTLSCHLQISVA